jgi:hypothetical protein
VALVLGAGVVGAAQGHHVDDFDVADVGGAGDQRLDQRGGGAASGLDPDARAGGDGQEGLGRGHLPGTVLFLPGHAFPQDRR